MVSNSVPFVFGVNFLVSLWSFAKFVKQLLGARMFFALEFVLAFISQLIFVMCLTSQ